MDNRYSVVDKPMDRVCTVHGQTGCPQTAHTLPTPYQQLHKQPVTHPYHTTATTAINSVVFFFFNNSVDIKRAWFKLNFL